MSWDVRGGAHLFLLQQHCETRTLCDLDILIVCRRFSQRRLAMEANEPVGGAGWTCENSAEGRGRPGRRARVLQWPGPK